MRRSRNNKAVFILQTEEKANSVCSLGSTRKHPSVVQISIGRSKWRSEFSHFFDLKNMISTYPKDFCEKRVPNSPDFG